MFEGVLVGLGLLHGGQRHVPAVARQLPKDPEVDVVLSSHMDLHVKNHVKKECQIMLPIKNNIQSILTT